MRPLSQRESRIVAVGLLLVALAAVWFGLLQPLVGGFFDRADTRAMLRETYARNQRVLAGISAWREKADEQKASASRFAIVAQTETLAAELLKQRLNKLATDEGGAVQAISTIQGDAAPGWVRVRADLQLTMGQLNKSLVRLEREAPYVVVGYLSVAADRAAKSGHLATMDVRIEVSAPVRVTQQS
jgi:type II secretory pathway component PulM